MSAKLKLLFSSLFALLLSGSLVAHFTYSWIISNKEIKNITLQSGEGTVDFKGFMFKSSHQNFDLVVDEDSLIEAEGGVDPSTGYLNFNFGGTISDDLLFSELVGDEHSLNTAAIPTFFLEIQAHTLVRSSFVKINIQAESFTNGSLPFNYRYTAIDNNPVTGFSYASPLFAENILDSSPTIIDDTSLHPLTIGAGAFNAYEIAIPLGATTDYETYFVKSFVIAISLDPISLYSYFKTNAVNGTINTIYTFNLSFRTHLEYSIGEFGA